MMAPRFLPVVMAPQPPTEWNRTAIALSGSAVGGALAVRAGAAPDRVLIGADRVLGPEVARAEAVDASDERRHLVRRDLRDPVHTLQRLVQRRADVAPHRV